MNWRRVAMAAAMLVLGGASGQAEPIYRWVDENGSVHFGSSPPPGQAAEAADLKFQRNPDPDAAEQRLEHYDENFRQRMADKETAAETRAEEQRKADQRAERCRQSLAIIERLREGRPGTRYRNEDGSYARYSDEQREAKLAEAEAVAQRDCD